MQSQLHLTYMYVVGFHRYIWRGRLLCDREDYISSYQYVWSCSCGGVFACACITILPMITASVKYLIFACVEIHGRRITLHYVSGNVK